MLDAVLCGGLYLSRRSCELRVSSRSSKCRCVVVEVKWTVCRIELPFLAVRGRHPCLGWDGQLVLNWLTRLALRMSECQGLLSLLGMVKDEGLLQDVTRYKSAWKVSGAFMCGLQGGHCSEE